MNLAGVEAVYIGPALSPPLLVRDSPLWYEIWYEMVRDQPLWYEMGFLFVRDSPLWYEMGSF
jgi:hypothetical protein